MEFFFFSTPAGRWNIFKSNLKMAMSDLSLKPLNGAIAPHHVFTGHLPDDGDTFVPRMETPFLLGLWGVPNDSPPHPLSLKSPEKPKWNQITNS